MKAIFITGTDTGIGKTFISGLLLREFNALKLQTFAIKPLASGCYSSSSGSLKNEDAQYLQAHASIKQPYVVVNPFALKEPIAPHLAAQEMGINLSKQAVKNSILSSIQADADINIIEGIGGWAVPLNDEELLSDVISELHIPVLLVVGIKLGCLNHSILTYKNILSTRVPFIGWVANCLVPNMPFIKENIYTLQKWINRPCLGIVPYHCESLGHIQIQEILNFLLQ
ncbi:MAG: bioD [Gammaproteobacteria bacterium]|jgi:dethiobiotin synthetase|nr:bioD [Gammaproteobacteria bacterium]